MSASPAESTPISSTSPCPCGSGRNYGDCCGPLITGTAAAPDAEALMRSRYTAHVVRDTAYLDRTYLPTSKHPGVDGHVLGNDTKWVKLEIHRHDADVKPGVSHVDFSAHFEERGQAGVMHEKSEFAFLDGRWIFTRSLREGPAPVVLNTPKVGRNDPCPCGSGKKYKKCCGS